MTTNNPIVWKLTSRIEYLRNEETSLITGSGHLLAYGITAHIGAVYDRLAAIKAEAQSIAEQLHALGLTDQAYDAADGWAIVIRPASGTGQPLSTMEGTP